MRDFTINDIEELYERENLDYAKKQYIKRVMKQIKNEFPDEIVVKVKDILQTTYFG